MNSLKSLKYAPRSCGRVVYLGLLFSVVFLTGCPESEDNGTGEGCDTETDTSQCPDSDELLDTGTGDDGDTETDTSQCLDSDVYGSLPAADVVSEPFPEFTACMPPDDICTAYAGVSCADSYPGLMIIHDQEAWDILGEGEPAPTEDWSRTWVITGCVMNSGCASGIYPYFDYNIVRRPDGGLHADLFLEWFSGSDECDGMFGVTGSIVLTADEAPSVGLYMSRPCGEITSDAFPPTH